MLDSQALIGQFTGLVVESLAIRQDFAAASVGCRRCGVTLGVGDPVTVALTCYAGHSWEIAGVWCRDHGADRVAGTMGVRAEPQAVVAATLETGRYDPPRGATEPRALVLGEVSLLEVSPTAEGYKS